MWAGVGGVDLLIGRPQYLTTWASLQGCLRTLPQASLRLSDPSRSKQEHSTQKPVFLCYTWSQNWHLITSALFCYTQVSNSKSGDEYLEIVITISYPGIWLPWSALWPPVIYIPPICRMYSLLTKKAKVLSLYRIISLSKSSAGAFVSPWV